MTCDRCFGDTISTTMSRFNTQNICDPCEDREKAHPHYQRAVDAELAQVQRGNYNYKGIGRPADLL